MVAVECESRQSDSSTSGLKHNTIYTASECTVNKGRSEGNDVCNNFFF